MLQKFLLTLVIIGGFCLAGCGSTGSALQKIDWGGLLSDAIPIEGTDDCGTTQTWAKELRRFDAEDIARFKPGEDRDTVVEGFIVVRKDCKTTTKQETD